MDAEAEATWRATCATMPVPRSLAAEEDVAAAAAGERGLTVRMRAEVRNVELGHQREPAPCAKDAPGEIFLRRPALEG